MPETANIVADPTRQENVTRILDCAERLFRHYGYGKTNVADIARELGMSPANIYRFFASKVEIHQAVCGRMLGASYKMAYEISRLPISAEERLRRKQDDGWQRWAAEIARRRGWRLGIFGRGWEQHPTFAPFDVITCFETLEHVQAQQRMIAGFARVLTDRATFSAMNRPSEGVRHLVVSGQPLISDGVLDVAARPGRPVRRPVAQA